MVGAGKDSWLTVAVHGGGGPSQVFGALGAAALMQPPGTGQPFPLWLPQL